MHVSCLGSWVGDVMDANGSCGCDAGTGFVAMQNLPESEDDDEEEGDEEIEVQDAEGDALQAVVYMSLRGQAACYMLAFCLCLINSDHAWYACTLSKDINSHMLPPRWVLWYCLAAFTLSARWRVMLGWAFAQWRLLHVPLRGRSVSPRTPHLCITCAAKVFFYFFTSETDHSTCFHFLFVAWRRCGQDSERTRAMRQGDAENLLKCEVEVGKHLLPSMTGTGFVAMRDLPESDEEDEGDENEETQAENHKQMQAVGTRTRILNGYVLVVLVLLCAIWLVFFMSSSRLCLLPPSAKWSFSEAMEHKNWTWLNLEHFTTAKRRYKQNQTNVYKCRLQRDRQLAQTHRRRKPRGKARQKRRAGSCSLTFQVKHIEANWEQLIEAWSCLLKELASFRCLRSLDWEVMKTLQTRQWTRDD